MNDDKVDDSGAWLVAEMVFKRLLKYLFSLENYPISLSPLYYVKMIKGETVQVKVIKYVENC